MRGQRGSNAARNRAWKYYLQKFSDEAELEIVVATIRREPANGTRSSIGCFLISMNWKGEPLVSFETVVNMISATKTKQGLRIKAVLDKRRYETGEDQQRADEGTQSSAAPRNPEWNYSLLPRSGQSTHS